MGGLARFGGVRLASQKSGGSGSGPVPTGQGVLSVQTVSVPTFTRLDQIDESTLIQGTIAYVGNNDAVKSSVGDYFALKFGQNLTPIPLEIVNALGFGVTGGQWVRMHIPNDQFLAPGLFWDVDPVNGQDENTGWGTSQANARLAPLKTMKELNRRLVGAINTAPTIEIEGNIPNADGLGLPNLVNRTRDTLPLIFGRIDPIGGAFNPPVFSGAITGYVTAVPATNTPFQMTIASLPVSWTASGLIGLMIQKSDGTKTAWAKFDAGAKTAVITQPRTSTTTSSGATTDFVVGETVNVYQLFSLPNWPYQENVLFPRTGNLEIKGLRLSGAIQQTVLGSSGPFVVNCKLSAIIWQGGSQATFGNVFLNGSNSISGMSQLNCEGIYTNGLLQLSDSSATSRDSVELDGAAAQIITFSRAFFEVRGGTLSIFRTTGLALDNTGQGALWCRGALVYGSGNANNLLTVDAGSRCAFPKTATVTTAAGNALVVGGAAYNFTDIPVTDLPNQCGVTDL